MSRARELNNNQDSPSYSLSRKQRIEPNLTYTSQPNTHSPSPIPPSCPTPPRIHIHHAKQIRQRWPPLKRIPHKIRILFRNLFRRHIPLSPFPSHCQRTILHLDLHPRLEFLRATVMHNTINIIVPAELFLELVFWPRALGLPPGFFGVGVRLEGQSARWGGC